VQQITLKLAQNPPSIDPITIFNEQEKLICTFTTKVSISEEARINHNNHHNHDHRGKEHVLDSPKEAGSEPALLPP
jgi:hypothetical protein